MIKNNSGILTSLLETRVTIKETGKTGWIVAIYQDSSSLPIFMVETTDNEFLRLYSHEVRSINKRLI